MERGRKKLIDHRIPELSLGSQAAEPSQEIKRAPLIVTNSIIISFSKGIKLLMNP